MNELPKESECICGAKRLLHYKDVTFDGLNDRITIKNAPVYLCEINPDDYKHMFFTRSMRLRFKELMLKCRNEGLSDIEFH